MLRVLLCAAFVNYFRKSWKSQQEQSLVNSLRKNCNIYHVLDIVPDVKNILQIFFCGTSNMLQL